MADTTGADPASATNNKAKPTTTWTRLQQRARTDEQRACMAAATRQADRVWVALHTGLLAIGRKVDVVPARDGDWHRLAVTAYDVLHASGAYAHLAQLRPRTCASAEPVIAAWLHSPNHPEDTDLVGHETTIAQHLGIGDAVHRINAAAQAAHLSTMLHAAQDAAVFGIPHHRIELATTVGIDQQPAVRVVVDTGHGIALASDPVALAELIPTQLTDVDTATATLRRVAEVATDLFGRHAQAVWHAPPPAPDPAATPTARAFPELRLDQRAAHAATPPDPAPATIVDRPRRPGRSR